MKPTLDDLRSIALGGEERRNPAPSMIDDEPEPKRSIEEIRDVWLGSRGLDGSDWKKALRAVYDLGFQDGLADGDEEL